MRVSFERVIDKTRNKEYLSRIIYANRFEKKIASIDFHL